ncbi:hypothetical protein HDU96_010931, partial [Phlyctochytrium bullatum]
MADEPNQQAQVLQVRNADFATVLAVYKLLARRLGPDFASSQQGPEDETKPSFHITITSSQSQPGSVALLAAAAAAEASKSVTSTGSTGPRPLKRRRKSEFEKSTQGGSLHDAARRNIVAEVTKLLEEGHDPYSKDAEGFLPIQLSTSKAVWNAFAPKMKTPDLDQFLTAMEDGDGIAARLLLAMETAPTLLGDVGRSAIHAAVRAGHEDVLQAILDSVENAKGVLDLRSRTTFFRDRHGEWNEGPFTPLHMATFYGKPGIARVLLHRGAEAEASRGSADARALHDAARYGHAGVVKVLLEHGADMAAGDADAWTPLHHAARHGHASIVKVLLNHGAKVMAVDSDGWTPLHHAAHEGHAEVCKAILEKDAACINVQDEEGNAALHLAIAARRLDVVRVLLQHGVNAQLKNANDEAPEDLARLEND